MLHSEVFLEGRELISVSMSFFQKSFLKSKYNCVFIFFFKEKKFTQMCLNCMEMDARETKNSPMSL